MLGIYADSFMTATRTRRHRVEDVPPVRGRRRWFRRARIVDVDLEKL